MKRRFSKLFVYILVVFIFAGSSFAMHQFGANEQQEEVAALEQNNIVGMAGEQAAQMPTAATELPPAAQRDVEEEELADLEEALVEEEESEQQAGSNENDPVERNTPATTASNTTNNAPSNSGTQSTNNNSSSNSSDSSNSSNNASSEDKPEVNAESEPKPAAQSPTPANPFRTSSARDHRYMTRVEIRNTGDRESRHVRIEVPLISSSSLYQSRQNESFSLEPQEIKTVSGTRVAVFALGTIGPGEEVVVEARARVRTSNIEFFADYVPTDNSKSSSYLGASSGIESTNSQIISLANQITQGLSSDWDKAEAITRWVTNNISYDASAANRNSGALQALQTRRGVCEDYAMLAAALARAAGIPARIAYGYTDNGNNWPSSGTFALRGFRHAWVEYSLEGRGWVPADPTRSNSSNLFFGRLPHNRYIIQNYSNISYKSSYSGGQLSFSWSDSLY